MKHKKTAISGRAAVVLGAGASRGEVRERGQSAVLPPLDSDFFSQLQKLGPTHEAVNEVLGAARDLFGPVPSVTMEQFFIRIEFLASVAQHFLGESPTVAARYAKVQQAFREALLLLLNEARVGSGLQGGPGNPNLHRFLFKHLDPGDTIISFNYDLVAEGALATMGGVQWNPATGYGVTARGAVDKWRGGHACNREGMRANRRRRGSPAKHEDESLPSPITRERNRMPLELSHLMEKTPCFPDVSGRVALVTGGGTGIGRGIARRLASEAMEVAICGRRPERLAETADLIQQAGGEVLAVPCDVSDAAAIDDLCERTLAKFGRVDALVHNAMAMHFPTFEEVTLERWDQTFATAPRAAFLLCQRLIPGMAERGHGAIVFVSSVLAQRPNRNGLPYVAAKGALEAMGRQLATAFAHAGIRVNTLAPGRIASRHEASEDSLPNELIPVGRAGTPAEMAAIVAFLLSDQSSYVTGQVIHADGGTSIQLVPPGFQL